MPFQVDVGGGGGKASYMVTYFLYISLSIAVYCCL